MCDKINLDNFVEKAPEVSWEAWLSLLIGIPLACWYLWKLRKRGNRPAAVQPNTAGGRALELCRRYEWIIALALLAPVIFTVTYIALVILTAIFLVVVFIMILLWVASTVKPIR